MEEPGNSPITGCVENPSSGLDEPDPKEALRIQAAAVAAQQAALTEEELRLEQRWRTLEQQEQQLGTHLEEKRRGLDSLRAEARQAQQLLRQDRAAFEQRVGVAIEQITVQRQELEQDRSALTLERRRLLDLRKRMILRWRRHWAKERAAIEKNHAELKGARCELQRSDCRLQQQKEALAHAWFKAKSKLDSRQSDLTEAQARLRAAERKSSVKARELADREAVLKAGERQLVTDKAKWEGQRDRLVAEIEGLESRARNARAKLLELQKGLTSVATASPALTELEHSVPSEPSVRSPDSAPCVPVPTEDVAVRGQRPTDELCTPAEALADQRLMVAEECLRLATLHREWHDKERELTGEVEALAHRLEQRELVLTRREVELTRQQQFLEEKAKLNDRTYADAQAIKIRYASQARTWEGEKNRLTHDLMEQQRRYEEEWQAAHELRQRWDDRRVKQVARLQSQVQNLAELQRELSDLREAIFKRRASLDQERRHLGERSLALEEVRQEFLAKAEDPVAAEKRFNVLLQQWSEESATIESAVSKERRALERDLNRIEERLSTLCAYHAELAARETELARRETAWEENMVEERAQRARLSIELTMLGDQRNSYQEENHQLREDIDRLAGILLEQKIDGQPSAQAA